MTSTLSKTNIRNQHQLFNISCLTDIINSYSLEYILKEPQMEIWTETQGRSWPTWRLPATVPAVTH